MIEVPTNALYDVLKAIVSIPEDELHYLHRALQLVRIQEGEFFIRAGEVPRHLGFVERGLMRIYYVGESADEFTTRFFMERTFAASYLEFVEQKTTHFNVQALEDSVLLALDLKAYTGLLHRHTCWHTVNRVILEDLLSYKLKRENDLLSHDAEARYARFLEEYPGLDKRVKQYHIASYLGINPVSLSRIRTKNRSA